MGVEGSMNYEMGINFDLLVSSYIYFNKVIFNRVTLFSS